MRERGLACLTNGIIYLAHVSAHMRRSSRSLKRYANGNQLVVRLHPQGTVGHCVITSRCCSLNVGASEQGVGCFTSNIGSVDGKAVCQGRSLQPCQTISVSELLPLLYLVLCWHWLLTLGIEVTESFWSVSAVRNAFQC